MLINENQFVSNTFEVWIRNLLSLKKTHFVRSEEKAKVHVKGEKTKIQARDKSWSMVEVLNIDATHLLLEIDRSVCALGHRVEIEVVSLDRMINHSTRFTATAKVISYEPLDEYRTVVSVQLVQFDNEQWVKILEARQTLQQQCLDLLLQEKGIPDARLSSLS